MVSGQSDQLVVAKRQGNACGAKELARMRRDARDTSAGHRTGERMSTKLASLTQRAKRNPKYKFISLMHMITEDYLMECLEEIKANKSSGIDKVSVEEYKAEKEKNIKELLAKMRAWEYQPKPSRRVYIPKPDGSRRGLGIPAVEDKIVQLAVKKILEAIFEQDFRDVSYGFRPNKSAHDALEAVDKAIMTKPINYIVDIDIEGFFDNIDHKWLMKCLKQRIADTNLLRLISRFLKAGIVEDGKFIDTEVGTPQGGIISPILANIYLHYILDLWFEKVFKKQMNGFAQLVRYADDFVVCFQAEKEAKEFGVELRKRLAKFNLKVAEKKARTIEFGRYVSKKAQKEKKKVKTFDFLGFTHYCDKTRSGKFKLGRKTRGLSFRRKIKEINLWLKDIRNTVKLSQWWKLFQRKLTGHYNYYSISGNMNQIKKFYWECTSLAYKWINRRSQKRSYNYEQYNRFLQYNPLPKPKIYHLTYTLSST